MPDVEVVVDINDLIIISYPYIEGSHTPETVGHLADICHFLRSMHEMSIAHGDIRLHNMVFKPLSLLSSSASSSASSASSSVSSAAAAASSSAASSSTSSSEQHFSCNLSSQLIDFDFSGQAGVKLYPAGYNRDIDDGDRHLDANAHSPLHLSHDLFSLGRIFAFYRPINADSHVQQLWSNATETLLESEDNALTRVIEMLDSISRECLREEEAKQQTRQTMELEVQ
jgi:serine/threonine protein kinase